MKHIRHIAALLSVSGVLSLAMCSAALAQEGNRPDPDPQRFANEIRVFEEYDRKTSPPADAILFVGSSSIRLWPTAQSFPSLTVINRGFGGSHVSDVNFYTERLVVKYKPKTVVFYAGDNDINEGKSPQQVFSDTRKFIQTVHERLPQARIYYLSIKPSVARWRLWSEMQKANALVRELADSDDKLDFVDMSPPLMGADGMPRADLLVGDGLHLNENGYRAWTQLVTPILTRGGTP